MEHCTHIHAGGESKPLKSYIEYIHTQPPCCQDTRLLLKCCHTESINTNKNWYCVILNSWVMQYCSSIGIHCNAIFLYDYGFKTVPSFVM